MNVEIAGPAIEPPRILTIRGQSVVDVLIRKLRLVMSAQLLLESGDVRSFVGILEDLGRADE